MQEKTEQEITGLQGFPWFRLPSLFSNFSLHLLLLKPVLWLSHLFNHFLFSFWVLNTFLHISTKTQEHSLLSGLPYASFTPFSLWLSQKAAPRTALHSDYSSNSHHHSSGYYLDYKFTRARAMLLWHSISHVPGRKIQFLLMWTLKSEIWLATWNPSRNFRLSTSQSLTFSHIPPFPLACIVSSPLHLCFIHFAFLPFLLRGPCLSLSP